MAAPEPPILYQGVSRSSAAFRLLKQMGWQEGEGLGKEKQGIREHIRVTKKKDNSGLGIDAQEKAARHWTFNTAAFDSILKNLNVIVADSTQDDDKKKATTHDAKLDEKSTDDLKLDEKLSFPKKATRPQGRYKKIELGKLLKGKSQADLNAILGYGRLTKTEVWPPASKDAEGLAEKPTTPESNCVPVERAEDDTSTIRDDQTSEGMSSVDVAIDWWGSRYGFVRAGALGQQTRDSLSLNEGQQHLQKSQSAKARVSFCEQDQEDLYKLVQDKATKGRQGLGIADRPKKIGGAHWKGQKVVLDADSDDNENEEILEEGTGNVENIVSNVDGCDKAGSPIERLPKRRKVENKLRWKKLCREMLQQAPAQTMKIKDLQKQIVELHSGGDAEVGLQTLFLSKEEFKEKLVKCAKFVVDGKRVSIL